MVTLQVFRAGRGPEDSTAQAVFSEKVAGGRVSAKWSYRANQNELPPERNPKFIFTAHSAWCNWEGSSNTLEVELRRPKITKAEWEDSEGKEVNKSLVGQTLKLHAETKGIGEGEGVTFTVYDKYKRGVYSVGAHVENGIAEAEWTYHYKGEKLTEKPKFTFEVTGQRCKNVESSEVEIGQNIDIRIATENGQLFKNIIIKNLNTNEEIKLSEGTCKKNFEIPSIQNYVLINETENITFGDYISFEDNEYLYKRFTYSEILNKGFSIKCSQPTTILIERKQGMSGGL